MQSSTTIPLNFQSIQFSWKSSFPPILSLQIIPNSNSNSNSKTLFSNTTFNTFSLFTSIKTSQNSNFRQPFIEKDQYLLKTELPVVVKKSGKDFKYFWNGNSLELICVDSEDTLSIVQGIEVGIRKFLRIVRDFFIPKQVTENYIEYVKWKFLHRVFSSSLQVLATQAMFRAIGVGHAQSLSSAAAMNWVLKDGLGRLSRCIYTACVGSAFDTNLKRVRFATSVMFSLSIGIELMTPAFPHCFLILASVANIAKQISLACYLATGTAVHRSFALADNMGEVSAKAQIQTVCFDNLGLLLAASLNVMFKNNERLELILNKWIEYGYVPSPAEVSKLEGVNLWENIGSKKGKWPIRIGCLDPKRQIPLLTVLTMNSLSREDFYFICLETRHGTRLQNQGILISLREGASTEDMILGLLQACYIRETLNSNSSMWEDILEGCRISHSHAMRWFNLIQDCKRRAQVDLTALQEQMLNSSWVTKNILLGTQEQVRYSLEGETNS
ncbi:protein root UVB sensitive 4 isoform X2 [Amaranthus tricolor]|uniref:protein root UVB sensitive 4 isoform X2 n=1 Tax=Amaranthus tricolor TaxID=29722 RepID=UPI002587F097|nr:protein root UVB sensitive 4 isoform X2 [Amaranthus tricolor]